MAIKAKESNDTKKSKTIGLVNGTDNKITDLDHKYDDRTTTLAQGLDEALSHVICIKDVLVKEGQAFKAMENKIHSLEDKINMQKRFIYACLLCIIILGIKIIMMGV